MNSHEGKKDLGAPPFRGLSPKVVADRQSIDYPKGQGKAWFAREDIEEGEIIMYPHEDQHKFEFKLEEVLSWPRERRRKFFRLAYQVDDDLYSGYHSDTEMTERQKEEWYCNHSCDPNVWFLDKDVIAARRHISAGEELYYDYATSETNDKMYLECMCESALCRKVIRGSDWAIPELQERYRGHFLPYVQRKIDNLLLQQQQKESGDGKKKDAEARM
ncbi:histone-lysine N-methyltransferase ATXR7 isoform X1 [Balamuthia mandrillaris]